MPRIYIMFPIKSLDGLSCLHACCSKNNLEALKQIVKFEILDISKNEGKMKDQPAEKYVDP